MNTIFMNSENKKYIYYILNSHILLLNITDKTDLRKKGKYIALSRIIFYIRYSRLFWIYPKKSWRKKS